MYLTLDVSIAMTFIFFENIPKNRSQKNTIFRLFPGCLVGMSIRTHAFGRSSIRSSVRSWPFRRSVAFYCDLRYRDRSLTSMPDDSLADRFDRWACQWADGWPIRRFTGGLIESLAHPIIHTSPQPFVRHMAHSMSCGQVGRYLAESTPLRCAI